MFEGEDSALRALPREELVERARALGTVVRVAHAVADARDLDDVAARFCDAVAAYTRFPSVVVLRFDPARDVFEVGAQHGFDVAAFPARSTALPAKGSLTGFAAERRAIVTTDDIANDDRIEPETRAVLLGAGYTSGASVPVVHDGEVLGAFNLVYPRGFAILASERTLLETLAQTLALSMAQKIATERERKLEAQALRAQQLESLGLLAGGIAHDFNNLLTGILGCVDVARRAVERAGLSETVAVLDEAIAASHRASRLVKQLLTFSRGGAPARRLVDDLERVIHESATFAARGTSVRCEVDVAAPLGAIEVDAGQIGQVLQNLVLNACQASPSGATVTVRAARFELAPGAPFVRIQVIDRGRGIPEEHAARIFEPFFTTRAGGTGLGLSVSYSIVKRHGGTLTLASRVGEGTTFTIELPASTKHARAGVTSSTPAVRSGGRALVMDDEPAVRSVASLLLVDAGFEVVQAEHGAEALRLAAAAASSGRPFDVAVLDLTIAGGRGAAEIAPDLRRISPCTRLILSSGYASDDASEAWDAILAKPFSFDELREAVAHAMDHATPASPAARG